jgi:hypothetical protein
MASATPTELTDEQWQLTKLLLPQRAPRREGQEPRIERQLTVFCGYCGREPDGPICPGNMALPLQLTLDSRPGKLFA